MNLFDENFISQVDFHLSSSLEVDMPLNLIISE